MQSGGAVMDPAGESEPVVSPSLWDLYVIINEDVSNANTKITLEVQTGAGILLFAACAVCIMDVSVNNDK